MGYQPRNPQEIPDIENPQRQINKQFEFFRRPFTDQHRHPERNQGHDIPNQPTYQKDIQQPIRIKQAQADNIQQPQVVEHAVEQDILQI